MSDFRQTENIVPTFVAFILDAGEEGLDGVHRHARACNGV
jgi:hypothetical protein